jgi:DNA-directed RNA polymerase specialized sigma24 family protein
MNELFLDSSNSHSNFHTVMDANNNDRSGREKLPLTRWSLIAQTKDLETRERALSELCQIYWYPMYAYIRSRGKAHHEAQDLAQGFFSQLLEREDFAKADQGMGRLRCYLCTAVKRFVIGENRKDQRLKRGGQHRIVSLDADEDERQFSLEPCEDETPEVFFDRRWASKVIETTLAALKAEYESKGRAQQFEEMQHYVCLNAGGEKQADVAARLDMTLGAFRMGVTRLRQRYGEMLRQTVADTLADPSKVDEEIDHLFQVFQ